MKHADSSSRYAFYTLHQDRHKVVSEKADEVRKGKLWRATEED